MPSPASTPNQFSFSNRNGKSTASLSSFDIDCFSNPPVTAGNDLSGFRVEDLTLPDDPSYESFSIRRTKIPSLREIRALNSISTTMSSGSPFPSPSQETGEQRAENTRSQQVLAQVQAFSSTIFTTQAEIAGISSAVAEYLAWLRKVPGLPKYPTDSAALLETLEARVRELQEMAEEKHWATWKAMLEKLDGISGGGGVGGCSQVLGDFEAELRERTVEVAREFHVSYDVGKAMHEQMTGPVRHGE
ncbi:MAG: hypothetical protein L6R39_000611 [Caloplaca ligustica]|nr:MAG: hypothetical protein L6R39_000611 [Caloplaca ligustica]